MNKLRVLILKPTRYNHDREGGRGYAERFKWGLMPNSTIPFMRGLTPDVLGGWEIETFPIDEHVQTDPEYLNLLNGSVPTLLALVGVQSNQFHRALDLAAYFLSKDGQHCVIGGPHPMTCDTSMLHGMGVSFAFSEAENVWLEILRDAIDGALKPVYGTEKRWQNKLESPILKPPSPSDLRRYFLPLMGIYPARGCPFTCNFCSVIKIAGRQVRSQLIETTMASLRAAKEAGVGYVMFTSDNFNKYSEAKELLDQMIEERISLPFVVQCDTQIARQEGLVAKLAKAGCFQFYIGIESLNRRVLLNAHKTQNHPETYRTIVELCRKYKIKSHFSNIIGFPEDTEASILAGNREIIKIGPDITSWYILTPIPGTEQYDDFLAEGVIWEPNLDQFDGAHPTWRHPTLSAKKLLELMFECYRRFYSSSFIFGNVRRHGFRNRSNLLLNLYWEIAMPIFARWCAFSQVNPLSGGIGECNLDSAWDYLDLRKKRFGYDLVPLPRSLDLSEADAALNRSVKLNF